jgi:hypothetical protein
MGDLPRWKNAMIFLSGEKYEDFSKWSDFIGDLPRYKMKDFQNGEKYEGFSKWFYYNGQLAQEKIFHNGLIIIDELSR